jgi:tetratricopeptide (TPR) repeat protein
VTLAAGAYWVFLRPRVISVVVYADPMFQMRQGWKERLEERFREVSRIYADQVGIAWKVREISSDDPAAAQRGMDQRRRYLADQTDPPADLLIEITGVKEGARSASALPFSHAAVIVDRDDQTEQENALVLAHELAHLFGVPEEAAGGGLMAPKPSGDRFVPRSAALIKRLGGYPFAHGTEALENGWDERVKEALVETYTGGGAKPAGHAEQTIAGALSGDGRYDAAAAHLKKALAADPDDVAVRFSLADVLRQNDQPDDAITVLREGLQRNASMASFHAGIGALLIDKNRQEAIEELRTASRLEPGNPNYYSELGGILSQDIGQADAATAAFRAALSVDPGFVPAQQGLTRVQATQAKAVKDAAALRQRAQQAPQNARAQYDWGMAEARAGNMMAAFQALESAVRLDPKLGAAHSGLAILYYSRGDYGKAWKEVGLSREAGQEPKADFLASLTQKSPPPK